MPKVEIWACPCGVRIKAVSNSEPGACPEPKSEVECKNCRRRKPIDGVVDAIYFESRDGGGWSESGSTFPLG